ncbi:hypothetical protein G7Z17_g4071 [Cylindrodendrum hubeiense]|uniref:Uncharacterized protein n=1 Tax=Cylindrodendrum hubeiense TaxID=595255 RepID=A0A9P5LA82_9HYPO|nr:hypothetical protein G7Z17_g4071 [Cylindrodendrum hubeiense]
MTSEPPRQKPPRRRSCIGLLQDPEEIRAQEAWAIENILPEARNDPNLYQRIVKKLRETGVGRCQKWGQYQLTNRFYQWAEFAPDEERPTMEFFLTILAAHGALARSRNDKFFHETKRRGLIEWAREQLQPKTPTVTKEQHHSNTSSTKSPSTRVSQESRGSVHPSIKQSETTPEQHSKRSIQKSVMVPSIQDSRQLTSPFPSAPSLKRKMPSHFEQDACQEPKVAYTHYKPHRVPVPTRDVATQTDKTDELVNARTQEMIDNIVGAVTTTFTDALARQTGTLTAYLPAAVRQAFQQDVADEVSRQQPRVIRPVEMEMAVARPNYPTYASARAQSQVYDVVDCQYEDVQTVGGRGRGLATFVATGVDRVLGVEAFRFTRGPEQRRF